MLCDSWSCDDHVMLQMSEMEKNSKQLEEDKKETIAKLSVS